MIDTDEIAHHTGLYSGTLPSFGQSPEKLPVLSEQMVRRDNHFHSCWMTLKFRRPDLWKDMTQVELYVSGYSDEPEEQEKEDEGTGTIL